MLTKRSRSNPWCTALFAAVVIAPGGPPPPSTFSIVAANPATDEVGIAVASKFFAVGAVVPWVRADAGAVATQANANTSWGPKALDLLAAGLSPEEALTVLKRTDSESSARQIGIVAEDGRSISWTGSNCIKWAGGRFGKNYAIQGNVLAGEQVVEAMEARFLDFKGDFAERLFGALRAGEAAGGDSRGRQSAALIVCRPHGGYNGFNDRVIDIRVDDNPDPFPELGRLLRIARMNDYWNRGWTLFNQKKFDEALSLQEKAYSLAPDNAEVIYDLAVIRLAAGKRAGALDSLKEALTRNPKLRTQAANDRDLDALRGDKAFDDLVTPGAPAETPK